jgi:hypothetical protein
MSARRYGLIGFVVLLLLAAGGVFWWTKRDTPIPTQPPSGAPVLGSCWQLDPPVARGTFPWPGHPIGCDSPHTAEVFQVGQVDRSLIKKDRSAHGQQAAIADRLMYAEARTGCTAAVEGYLGGDWHRAQVTLVIDWIRPARDGFYGCALAQTPDAAGTRFTSRTASLRGAAGALPISCVVNRSGGSDYASCDQEHDGEFVGSYTLTPPNAPFEATSVARSVTAGCAVVLRSYLGLPADGDRTDLRVGYVGPSTSATWLGSDQTFDCYAVATAGVRGSIRRLGTRPLTH